MRRVPMLDYSTAYRDFQWEVPNTFNFDQLIRIKIIQKKLHIKEIPIKTIYADERSQLHIMYAIKFFIISIIYFLRLDHFLSK